MLDLWLKLCLRKKRFSPQSLAIAMYLYRYVFSPQKPGYLVNEKMENKRRLSRPSQTERAAHNPGRYKAISSLDPFNLSAIHVAGIEPSKSVQHFRKKFNISSL